MSRRMQRPISSASGRSSGRREAVIEMSEEENSDNECEEDMLSSDEETENKVQATREMESQDSEADSVVSKM